ncbi:hypothetical protein FSP39_011915 [Pinctada imbricata]|uniref:J domain-containing protein n=1 Tax=Pinctada imbricata TaxID=66713 RepID=A0AA88XVB6_PINIB|nr:hypothetical protein FSP39_011915 [Pinctada imbricata]
MVGKARKELFEGKGKFCVNFSLFYYRINFFNSNQIDPFFPVIVPVTNDSQLHPDKNLTIKDTHSRFLEIQEAYNILSNEESRKIYDSSFKSKDAIFDEEQMDKEMTTTMNQDEQRMYSEWRGSKSSRRSRSKQHFRVEMEGSTSQPHQFVLQITVFMVFIIASISFANRVLDYRRDDNLAQILKDGFKK